MSTANTVRAKNWEEAWIEFKRQFDVSLRASTADATIKNFGGEMLHPERHANFYRQFNQVARACNFKPNETVLFVVDTIAPKSKLFRDTPNVAANPVVNFVISTKSALRHFNTSIHGQFSEEFKAVLAHEISHLKDGGGHILEKMSAPLWMPLITVAGYYLYEKAAQNSTPQADTQTMQAAIADVAEQEKQEFDAKVPDKADVTFGPITLTKAQYEHNMEVAKYAAAAAVGIAAGLFYARHHSLASEFRADRAGVALLGRAEPLERSLTQLSAEWKKIVASKPAPKTMGEYFQRAYEKLIGVTLHAHPSLEERIAAIRAFEKEMLAKTHMSAGHPAMGFASLVADSSAPSRHL